MTFLLTSELFIYVGYSSLSVIKYVLQMSSLTLWLAFPLTGVFFPPNGIV